jgi:outer membrane protein
MFVPALLGLPARPCWTMAEAPRLETQTPAGTDEPFLFTLEDCFRYARTRSEILAIADEEIRKTTAQFLQAAGEAFGDVNFVMNSTYQETQKARSESSGVGGTLTSRHRRERKFVITQPLFQGFKSVGALAGAGSTRKARRQERLRAEQLLFLEVAAAFFDLLSKEKELEIIRGIHRLLAERVAELRGREKIGRSRLSEVVTARTRMKTLQAELARLHGELAIARHRLYFLTGLPLESSELKDAEVNFEEKKPLEAFVTAADNRPDIEAAHQAMKTAAQSVVVAQSELWPEISLENNLYEKREGFQSGIDYDLLLKIDVPLAKGGATLGKVKEAKSEWKKAKLVYRLAKREADFQIREAYEVWQASIREYRALELALKGTEENYRLQRDEYKRNLVSNLDVLEALESLIETRREASRLLYETKQNYWRLKIATGVCCESL